MSHYPLAYTAVRWLCSPVGQWVVLCKQRSSRSSFRLQCYVWAQTETENSTERSSPVNRGMRQQSLWRSKLNANVPGTKEHIETSKTATCYYLVWTGPNRIAHASCTFAPCGAQRFFTNQNSPSKRFGESEFASWHALPFATCQYLKYHWSLLTVCSSH